MSRLVLLSVWAEHEFGDPVPASSTLNKYAKNGMISPAPQKVGKSWRVEQDARFVGMTTAPEGLC
nr:excisionase [Klebsiella pneumoniae]